MLDFVIFAFTALFGLVIFLLFFWLVGGPKTEKPGGKKVPRWEKEPADPKLGDMGELATHGSLHEYLLHLHDRGRCPVTSFWWSPDLHVVSLCSPQTFKDSVKLTDRPPILFKGFEPLISSASIQYANGSDWEERRKCLYSTLKGEDLMSYFPHFVQIAQETEARWGSQGRQKISLTKETFHMTIKGICRSCFGGVFDSDKEVDTCAENYHTCWREQEMRIRDGDPEPGSQREIDFQRSLQFLKDTVRRVLKTRRESKDTEELPFIDALLQSGVPEQQIVADAISFMVGGFHTSGYFMAWLFWMLATHPEVQEKVREEVQELVGGECGDRLKEYALNGDTYLRQVEDETLRWATVGDWAARFSDKDMKVAGYEIPAHTPMIHAIGVGLYNETEWDNVDTFDPDRFAKGSPHARRGLEFCPFGIPSRRKCPGYLFSYFEVSIFTAVFLNRFTLEAVEGHKVEKFHGLVTEPKEEIYIYVTPVEDK